MFRGDWSKLRLSPRSIRVTFTQPACMQCEHSRRKCSLLTCNTDTLQRSVTTAQWTVASHGLTVPSTYPYIHFKNRPNPNFIGLCIIHWSTVACGHDLDNRIVAFVIGIQCSVFAQQTVTVFIHADRPIACAACHSLNCNNIMIGPLCATYRFIRQ